MNPGATMRPRASSFSSAPPRTLFGTAISATPPSRSRTSMGAFTFAAGSIRCPPLMRRLLFSFCLFTPNLVQSSTFVFSEGIRFDEADHLMAELPWLFQVHQMSGIADDHAFRSGNTRLNGPSVRVNIRDVRITDKDKRGNSDLTQPTDRRHRRARIVVVGHILRIRGQQGKQSFLSRVMSGRE